MICKKCKANIPADSAFCPECGEPCTVEVEECACENVVVEEVCEAPAVEEKTAGEEAVSLEMPKPEKKEKKKGKGWKVAGIIVGVLCMVYGLISFLGAAHGLDTASFGADFYTYTYDGIYASAVLLQAVTKVCSLLLFAVGFCMTYFFATKNK